MTHFGIKKLLVLVDLDQTLADFEGHFLEKYKEKYPGEPYIELKDRETFYIGDQYEQMEEGLSKKVKTIYTTEGFFRDLPPLEGACKAVLEMEEMDGVEVFICSSPLFQYKYSSKEKYEWVEHHLGKNWINKLILTRDKTMVTGNILIDDKVKVTGAVHPPAWTHIVFTACHNKHIRLRDKKRLDNWTDGSWRALIEDFKKRI
ncbi:hypothetical protein FSP39_020905 [Pinctada imbricata]|uniref:Uncharacterized protein n=1 Tax=Pinctada imbricata TaxID=66713 RepID=A0AA89BXU7_PINIB|nr:hypothetical protein FSP39_020905 [Pinctada imbricata]